VLPYDNDGTFFQTGQRYENNLSLRGGSEQVRFFASMGHLYQLGVVPNTTFERISLRANTDFTLSDRLSLSVSANYIHSQGDRANRGSNLSGVMLGLMRTPPSFDLSNGVEDPATNPAAYVLPDGSQRTYHSSYDNPYWSINKNRSLSEVDRLIGYTEARYDPFSWLKLTYRLSADIYTNLRKSYWDNLSNEFGTGRMFDEFIRQQNLNSDLIVRIDPALDGPLSISAILGHNYNQLNEVIYEAEGFQFVLPDFYDLSNISQENLEVVDDLIFRRKLIGAYSDIKLGWKDYLFLDGTFRADWSSTLPASSNPFFSPSLSLSFIFSDAFGWKDAKVFSYGKLRLSAARGGNDAPFEYATGNYYLATTPTQGLLSYFPSAVVGNPSLLPVTTTSYEGGADLRLFSNRLRIDLTYYRAATTNQIFEADLPGSTGFASVLTNGGEILNEGIEAIIQGAILQPSEGLQWDVTVNFTRNRNTVVSISESLDNIALPSFGLASTSSRVIAGEAYGVLYGTRWLRNDAGDILVNDLGYPITDSLNGIIGNPNPDWLMGLRNSFRWGPWRLDFLFDIRQGGDMFNGTAGVMKNHGTHLSTETRAEDYVWPGVRASDGGVNTTPIQLDQAFYQRYPLAGVSEASVEEISWVRLREVNLGFALPAAWLKSLPLTQATLTLTGRNLWLRTPYSGIDPETTLSGAANSLGRDYFNMPNTRSYGANLILTF
jgi:TonB-linked SusC/RagA family outer membrane protein